MAVMPRPSRKAIVITTLLAAGALQQARAETRTTSFATFLHVGPGRQYAVSDEVPTRTAVEVNDCEKDWCRIRYGNAFGWIDQRMLAAATPAQPAIGGANCVDYARTGWPNNGDHERLCLPPAK